MVVRDRGRELDVSANLKHIVDNSPFHVPEHSSSKVDILHISLVHFSPVYYTHMLVQPHTAVLWPATTIGVVHNLIISHSLKNFDDSQSWISTHVLVIRIRVDAEISLDQVTRLVCGEAEEHVNSIHISRVEPDRMSDFRGLVSILQETVPHLDDQLRSLRSKANFS